MVVRLVYGVDDVRGERFWRARSGGGGNGPELVSPNKLSHESSGERGDQGLCVAISTRTGRGPTRLATSLTTTKGSTMDSEAAAKVVLDQALSGSSARQGIAIGIGLVAVAHAIEQLAESVKQAGSKAMDNDPKA